MKVRSVVVILIFVAMVSALMVMGISEQSKIPETPAEPESSVESSEPECSIVSEEPSEPESSVEISEPESSEPESSEPESSDPESYAESSEPESSLAESYDVADMYVEREEESSEEESEAVSFVNLWDYYDGRRYGDMGRLIIPNVGVSVALYKCDWFDKPHRGQACVDNYDSAAWLVSEDVPDFWSAYFDNSVIIADHNEQGFNAIKSMKPGDFAYIYHSDGICEQYEYVKTDYNGSNVERYMPEINYNLWKPQWSDGHYATAGNEYPEYITMYTCNDWYGSITLVLLKRVE